MGLIDPFRNNIFNTPYSELHSQQEEPLSVDDFYGQHYDDLYQQPEVQPDILQQQPPEQPLTSPENEFIRSKLLETSKAPSSPHSINLMWGSTAKHSADFEETASKNAAAEAQEERPVADDWRDSTDSQGQVRGKRNPSTLPGALEFKDKFYFETENLVTSQDWDKYIKDTEQRIQNDLLWGRVEEHNVWEQLIKEQAYRFRDEAQKKESWGPEKSAEYDARKSEQKEKFKAGYAAAKDGLLFGLYIQDRDKPGWGERIGRALLSSYGIPMMPTDDVSVLRAALKRRYPNLDGPQLESIVEQSLSNAKAWKQIESGATSDTDALLELMNRKVGVFEQQPGLTEVELAPWDAMLARRRGKKTTKIIEDPEQKKKIQEEQAAWTAEHSALYDSLYNKIEQARKFGGRLQKQVGSIKIGGQDIDLETYFVSQIENQKARYQGIVDKQRAEDNALFIMKALKDAREADARRQGLEEGSPKWKKHTHVDRDEIYEWQNNFTETLKNSYENSLAVRYTPIRLIQRSVSKFVLEATSLGFTSMEQAFDEQRYGPSMDWYSADTVRKIIGASERAMHKAAKEDLGETGAWIEGVFAEVAPQLLRMAVVRHAFKLFGVSGAVPFTASVSWGGSQEAMNALREQAELGVPKDKMFSAGMLMFAAEVIPEAILYGAGAGVARQIFNPAQYSNWMRGLGTSFMVAAKNAPAELVQEWVTTFMQQHVRANFGIDPHATSPEQMYAALKRTFWVSLGMSIGGGVTSAIDSLSLVNQLRKMDHITPEMYEEFARAFQENREKRRGFGVVDTLDKAHEFVAMFRAEAHRLLELGPDKATTRKNWEEHGPGEQDKDGKPIRANTEQRKKMFDWIATAVAELEDTAESVQQEKDALEEQKPVQDFEVSAINRETGEETTITVPAKNIEDAEESVTGYKTPDGDQLFDPATEQEAPVEEAETDSLMDQTQEMLAPDESVEPVAQEPVGMPQEPQVDPVREEVADRVDSKGMGAIDAAAELDPSGTLMDRVNQEVPTEPTEAPTEVAPTPKIDLNNKTFSDFKSLTKQEKKTVRQVQKADVIRQAEIDMELHDEGQGYDYFDDKQKQFLEEDKKLKQDFISIIKGEITSAKEIDRVIRGLEKDKGVHAQYLQRKESEQTGSHAWHKHWMSVYDGWIAKLKQMHPTPTEAAPAEKDKKTGERGERLDESGKPIVVYRGVNPKQTRPTDSGYYGSGYYASPSPVLPTEIAGKEGTVTAYNIKADDPLDFNELMSVEPTPKNNESLPKWIALSIPQSFEVTKAGDTFFVKWIDGWNKEGAKFVKNEGEMNHLFGPMAPYLLEAAETGKTVVAEDIYNKPKTRMQEAKSYYDSVFDRERKLNIGQRIDDFSGDSPHTLARKAAINAVVQKFGFDSVFVSEGSDETAVGGEWVVKNKNQLLETAPTEAAPAEAPAPTEAAEGTNLPAILKQSEELRQQAEDSTTDAQWEKLTDQAVELEDQYAKGLRDRVKAKVIDVIKSHPETKDTFSDERLNKLVEQNLTSHYFLSGDFFFMFDTLGPGAVRERTSDALTNKQQTVRALSEDLFRSWARAENLDEEGVFGPLSGWHKKKQAAMVQSFFELANDIHDAIGNEIQDIHTTPTEAAKEPTLSEKIIAIGQEVNDAVADPNAKQLPNVFAQFAEILPEVNAELADEIAKVMGAESFAAIPEDTLRAVQADVQKFLETGKAPSSAMAQLFVVYRDFINKTISTPGQVPPKKIQELLNAEVTVAPIQEKELNDVLDKYSDSDLVRLAQRMKIDVTDKSVSQIRDEISDVVATEVYLEDATNRLELSDQTAERKQQVETAKDSVRKAYEDLTKLGAKYDPKEQAEKELKLASAIYNYLYAKVKDTGVTVAQASAKMFSDLGIKITKDNYASVQKILNEQVSKVQEDYFKANPEEKPLTEKELKGLEAPTYKGAAFLADHINKGTPATVEQFYSHMEKNMAGWKDMTATQKVKAWYDALVLSTYATTEAPAAGQQEGKGLTAQQIKQRSLMRYMFTKMQQAKTPQEAKRLIDAMRGVGSRYQKTVDAVVRRLEKANEKYELLKSQNKLTKLSQRQRTQELDEIKKEWQAITRELQSDVSKKDWITKLTQKELAGEFKSHEEMLAAAFKLQGVIKEVSRKQAIKKLKKTLSNFNRRSQLPYFEEKFADLIKDIDANLLDPNMSAEQQDKKLRNIIFRHLLPNAVEGVKLQTTRDGKTVEVLLSEIGDKPSPEQVTSLMKVLATAPASMFGLPAETVKSLQDTAKLLSRKNVNNLTEEEADSVRASVVGFIHQNKVYKGYFKKQSNADIQAKALESAQEIFQILAPVPVPQGPQVTKPGRLHPKLQATLGLTKDVMEAFWGTTSLATPETMAIIISGGENTATHKILYGNLADASKAQSQTLYNNQQFLVHALKQAGIDLNDPAQAQEFLKLSSVYAEDEALNETLKKMTVVSEKKPAITEVFSLSTKTVPVKQTGARKTIEGVDGVALQSEMSLTPMQIAGLIVQFRDPHWRKLIAVDNKDNPGGWTPLQFRQGGEKYYLSNKDIEAILNYDGAHSNAVHTVANAVWDQINGPMGTAVREYMLSVDGVDTTREFYAPGLRVRKSQEVEVEQLTPSSLRTSQAALKQLNILKSLTQDKKSGVLIQDALHMYANHSQFTSALQHMAAPLAEAAAVMDMLSGKQEIVAGTKGVSGFLGKGLWQAPNGVKVIRYYEDLLNSLTVQAMGRKGPDVGDVSRNVSKLARNITVGGLGLNPRVWMYQVTSLSTASSEIQWKYIAQALKGGRKLSWAEAARSGITGKQKRNTTQDEINFWSTLRDRSIGQRFGLVSEGLSDSTQHPLIHKKTLSDKFMAGIGGMDAVTIRTIWEAAKLELNDKINDPNYKGNLKIPADWQSEPAYWKALDKRAQQIVDRTQPSMDLMHLSGLARRARQGDSGARLVTMFMAQRMKNVNLGLRAVHDFRQGNVKGAANKAASVLFYQTVGIAAIKEVYDYGSQSIWGMVAQGLTGLPEEPKDPIKPAAEYMDYIIGSWFSNLPLGQFPGYLAQQAFKATTGHKGKIYTPPMSPVLSTIDALAGNKLTSPKQFRRFLLDAATASGAPVHFAREFNKAYNRLEIYTKIISRRNRALNKEIKDKYKGDHNRLPKDQRKEYDALTKPLSYEKGGETKTTTYAKRIDQLTREANALEKEAKDSQPMRAKELNRRAQNIRNEADKLSRKVFEAVFK